MHLKPILRRSQNSTVSFNTHLLYDDNIKIPIDRNDNGIIDPGEHRDQGHNSRRYLVLDFHINSDINN